MTKYNAIVATNAEHNKIMSYLREEFDGIGSDVSDIIEAQLVLAYQKGLARRHHTPENRNQKITVRIEINKEGKPVEGCQINCKDADQVETELNLYLKNRFPNVKTEL